MRIALVFPLLLAAVILFCGPATAAERICFEAESASTLTTNMLAGGGDQKSVDIGWTAVKGASGNRYLEIPQGRNPKSVEPDKPAATAAKDGSHAAAKEKIQDGAKATGEAVYTFTVKKDGTFFLWCRVWWLDACGNSVGMSLDNAPGFTFGQDGTYKHWHWVKAPPRLKQLKLSKGDHTLKLTNREDGIRIDQILLVNDRRYVPVDIEDTTP